MGATLTLSNFGSLFGRYANPVVHPVLPLSLTFDHRVVTGGEAARFFKALEQPGP